MSLYDSGITTSPSHEHVRLTHLVIALPLTPPQALIALRNGELRAYDLQTLRWSPHPAPNLWAAYESKMMATGALITSRAQR